MSETVIEKIQKLTPARVHAWLVERLENACRISGLKAGKDRDGWLEDAAYLTVAVKLVQTAIAAQPVVQHNDLAQRLRHLAFHWREKGFPTDADVYDLAASELERLGWPGGPLRTDQRKAAGR